VTPHLTQDASSQLSSGQTFEPAGPLIIPVLFLVFNRPDQTFKVFEAIRRARPPRLYIAADGARPNQSDEAQKCEEVRKIVGRVDWPCQVKTLLRAENLGCRRAVSSAINWFFDNEAEGVVLEDDCLPAQSFFWFCQELLTRFRDDERVWQICGTAFLANVLSRGRSDSYIFSKYGPIWGWASWRRAWSHYDPDIRAWPLMREISWLNSVYENSIERRVRLELGNKLFRNEIDTWDYQWGFIKNYQNALSVIPRRNLVANIGFGPEATHTTAENILAPSEMSDITFPIEHPLFVVPDGGYDGLFRERMLLGPRRVGAMRKLVQRTIQRFCRKRTKA
jgi:hypothetical protein